MSELPFAEVIGDPIAHSKSPTIHKFWLERAGIKADYRASHVRSEDLRTFLEERRRNPSWRGCNVTIPHKQAVMPLLDRIDPAAERIGAVNTIVPEDGKLTGYNTDYAGFLEPIRPLLAQQHLFRMARVFGAGGAAKAVVLALHDHGFTIVIAARDLDKARALRESFEPDERLVAPIDIFADPTDFPFDDREGILDLVVNATSLGMDGQPPLALDFTHVPPDSVVYDIVYAPLETPLLAEARAHGLRTVDGLHMLIGQAAEAFGRFFGRPAPRDADDMLRALLVA
ncbi:MULTISPECIES: shikimate dehydrogenase [unclassified Sphingomonas]|uniref:shikimate dehydrogenase n=1 Tax=unclassified Sphingomonas TaxID=196159 RepID=UPI0006F5C8A6|nr:MULTISPECIES: shikimate dehydrogenase [unclassified Sphingomonas]KQX21535.1 shikimate dehydrogenase [Sphingomonas sp. Root1294]KQY72852.1 shikimate dehydrogenase [Sphingomonas sp. Root50]KRB88354.1 shikimate dehydrogenase [Sphingomonas sp. Root720]